MSTLAQKCRQKAAAEGLASLMNDTKWEEIRVAMYNLKNKPAWRTRDLLNGYLSHWDSEWLYHLMDFCSIEWLEIKPKDCDRETVRAALHDIGAPFEESDTCFRVIGYKK